MTVNIRIAAVAAVLVASCVSAPKAPVDVETAAKQFSSVQTAAQLYLVRPSSFGLAIMYQISIDGRLVGSLPAEAFRVVTLPAGRHTASFFNSTSQEVAVVETEAGKNYYLRVGMNPGTTSNRARWKLVREDEGQTSVKANTMVSATPMS